MTQSEAQCPLPRLASSAGSPDIATGIAQILRSIHSAGVPKRTLALVHMRTSQINCCNACIAGGFAEAASNGISVEQMIALPAWRDSSLFDDADRAAIELAEAMTRQADHADSVTDEIWARVAAHFDERALTALVSMIALANFFNRVNATLRVQPGAWQ